MLEKIKNLFYLRRRLLIFLAVFGPATITAMADNDGAGVATYSLAGAKFGYSILFVLIPITILLAITQEMGVRIAMVTGKGLGDLIRERFGIRISMLVFLGLLIANIGTVIADFAAVKATAQLFNIPIMPLVVGIVILAFLFVTKGNYRTNQTLFLISAFLYVAYIISAFKANPDWGRALGSMVNPSMIHFSKEYVFAAIAVLGTTITPWGQFFVNSYVIDKKLTQDKLQYEQAETYFGAFLTDFFSFFMIIATAATLFVHNIPLNSGEAASLAIRPFAGDLAGILFGMGILNAGLMGIVIVSLSTAYAFSEFFGFEGSLDNPFNRGRLFYGLFLFQLLVGAAIVLFPYVNLFGIVFYTQALNAILIPFVMFFLLKITNSKGLMGKHVNNRFFNYFAIAGSVLIVAATVFSIFSSIFS